MPQSRDNEARQTNYQSLESFLKVLEAFDRDASDQMGNGRDRYATPKPDSDQESMEFSDYEEEEDDDEEEDDEIIEVEPPEPREKQVKYDKLLKQTERDLGWYGKYDRCGEWREESLAVGACHNIGARLGKLSQSMGQHRSYARLGPTGLTGNCMTPWSCWILDGRGGSSLGAIILADNLNGLHGSWRSCWYCTTKAT